MRLTEVAVKASCPKSMLVERAANLDWAWLEGVEVLGLSAGASAPEELVEEIILALGARFDVTTEDAAIKQENVTFRMPRVLSDETENAA